MTHYTSACGSVSSPTSHSRRHQVPIPDVPVPSAHISRLRRGGVELLPEAVWQRCSVHFLRNALDYLPRKADDDCRQELRWLYDRRDLKEAQQALQAWLQHWAQRCPRLTDWVETHQRDAELLPATTSAPQAPEGNQPA